MKDKRLKPKNFLLLLITFSLFCVFVTRRVILREYVIFANTRQSFENLQPRRREEEVHSVTDMEGLCGTPVTIYEDIENCQGGGAVEVDFAERNGGTRSGNLVYSKDLSLKISKITIPIQILSGTDIPNTNITIKEDEYILPGASSLFVDRHEDVGRFPGRDRLEVVEYETWATVGELSFSELGEPSQRSELIVDEYVETKTPDCASCSTNSDRSEQIGELVNNRTLFPGHSISIESKVPVLMCKDEDSIYVDAKRVACIDEQFSFLKRVTAIFSSARWEQCNKVEYDEEGNLISDGRCIDMESVVLDLSGIFSNTNAGYKKIVDKQLYPASGYDCEMSLTFPAWVEVDGKGIYRISAKMNVPYECWRKSQEFDDTDKKTPSRRSIEALIEYIEILNRDVSKF